MIGKNLPIEGTKILRENIQLDRDCKSKGKIISELEATIFSYKDIEAREQVLIEGEKQRDINALKIELKEANYKSVEAGKRADGVKEIVSLVFANNKYKYSEFNNSDDSHSIYNGQTGYNNTVDHKITGSKTIDQEG